MTIADLFESYKKHVIPARASEAQILETRRAFYGGVAVTLDLLLNTVGTDAYDEDAGVEFLETLRKECEAFAAAGGMVAPTPPVDEFAFHDPAIRDQLRDVGREIRDRLPVGWGFLLMLFQYGEGGGLFYMSSAERADVLQVLEEFKRRQVQ